MAEFDGVPDTDADPDTIDPESLHERVSGPPVTTLLDVRSAADHEAWKITGDSLESINIPYFEFLEDDRTPDLLEEIPRDREVIVYCGKGGSSEFVAGILLEEGFDALHLEDGMNGWARFYNSVEISSYDGTGTVVQYQRPSSGCLGYLIYHDGEAAIIDPLRAFVDRYLADASDIGVELRYALDTHVHADHISGVRQLSTQGVEAVIPAAAADRGVTYLDAATAVTDGETFAIGDITLEAVATPGHTTEMTSYLVDDSFLVTGDGLFIESVARPDLEAGDKHAPAAAETLYESLQNRILTLPDETLIGGGHYSEAATPTADGAYVAQLGELTATMGIITDSKNAFVEAVVADMPPRPANYEDIIATNLGSQTQDDEEAFALELGPNNCAASTESLTDD